jgi:hypothetical protein
MIHIMIRTQIQLPEDLYDQIKRLAERKQWSMAEAIRRGAERLISEYPEEPIQKSGWSLPVLHGSLLVAGYENLREIANEREP